jgi:hypothetical protein
MFPDADLRPQTTGSAHGVDWRQDPVVVDVTWVVDTGAAIPVVARVTADKMVWKSKAVSAGRLVTGAISVTDDIEVAFDLDDGGVGRSNGGDVGVRGDNIDEHLLGMSLLAAHPARLAWEPGTGTGDLEKA